jgi:hypothetical protein
VSSDVKNQEPWTARIKVVWRKYQSSGFSKDPWQARHSSTPTTSKIHSSSINDAQGDVNSQDEQYYHRESRSTNSPMLASNLSTGYQIDTFNGLSRDPNHSFVCIGIASTSTTPPTILHEQDPPTSREEDTSTFSQTHQKRQYVQEETTTPSNTDEVKDIIRDIRSDDLLGWEEQFNRPYPNNYEIQDPAKSHRYCFERYLG